MTGVAGIILLFFCRNPCKKAYARQRDEDQQDTHQSCFYFHPNPFRAHSPN